MKKLLLLFFAVTLLGCSSNTSKLDTEYIRLNYPSEWFLSTENLLAQQPGFENILATYIFDIGKKEKSQFIINVEPNDPNAQLEDYRTLTKQLLSENFEEAELITENNTTLDGAPSITLAHRNAGRLWLQSWTLHDNKIYTITLATPEEISQTTMPQAMQILESTRLKP